MCHLTWWHFDVLRYRQGVECLSVVWVIAMMSSYSLCFALCCGWPGLVVHADVSPVLSPDSVALVSSLSPAAPVVASWHVVPAAAERQMFITHLFNYSRYTVFFFIASCFLCCINCCVDTFKCSCIWAWCWRTRFSCCFWNSLMSNCFWICCCFWMRSSSCWSCLSHTVGSEAEPCILMSVRKSSGEPGSRANGTSGLMSTEKKMKENTRI